MRRERRVMEVRSGEGMLRELGDVRKCRDSEEGIVEEVRRGVVMEVK